MGGVEEPTTLAPYLWLAASEMGKEAVEGRLWWWWLLRWRGSMRGIGGRWRRRRQQPSRQIWLAGGRWMWMDLDCSGRWRLLGAFDALDVRSDGQNS